MNKELFAAKMRLNPTAGEEAAWTVLKRFRCEKRPVWKQQVLYGYIVDFLLPNERIVVEIDGLVHTTPEAKERDAIRQANIEAKGYRFIRVTNGEAMTDSGILHHQLERALNVSIALPMKRGAKKAKAPRPAKPDWFERRMAKTVSK